MAVNVVLSAAGKLRAACLHGASDEVIVRRRKELTMLRAIDLLNRSGALPLDADLVDELAAAARGV